MPGAGAARYVDHRIDVRLLPAAGQLAPFVRTPVDLGDEHEPVTGEQRARVAGDDDVVAGRAVLPRDEPLDRARVEARAQPLERPLDLRHVVARDEIGGLQLLRCHAASVVTRATARSGR